MRFLLLLPILSLAQIGPSDRVDADQFSRTIESLHKDIHDYSFVLEGTLEMGPARRPTEEQREAFKQRYQSFYRYRSDGATYLDVTSRGSRVDSFARARYALLRDLSEELTTVPDSRVPVLPIISKARIPLQLFSVIGSPQRLLAHWYFERFKNLKEMGYEHLGWEEVDGHNCIKIKLFLFTSPPPKGKVRSQLISWIDLERSGNILKQEMLIDPPQVSSRLHGVQLQRFPLPEGRIGLVPRLRDRRFLHGQLRRLPDRTRRPGVLLSRDLIPAIQSTSYRPSVLCEVDG